MRTESSTPTVTAERTTARERSAPRGVLTRWSGWIVAAAAALSSALLLHAARGTSFFLDEWWFITQRRDGSIDDFLRPHFGHLIAIPVGIFNVMFDVFGLRARLPYVVLVVALHVLTCTLLFVYLRRRGPVLYATLATVVMLFLGNAWEDLIWAFQITFLLSTAAGMATLLLLDRRDRVGNLGAMATLTVSIASGGIGLVFAGGALVELLWTRADRRRVWVTAAPLALYALWHVTNSNASGSLDNFERLSPFTTTLAGEAAGAVLGTSAGLGQLALVVLLVAVCVRTLRGWPVPGRFVNTVLMLVGYWILLTYTRGGDALFNRYVYMGALLLVLVVGELVAAWPATTAPPRSVVVVGALLLGLLVANSLIDNVGALADGGAARRRAAVEQRAMFSALVAVASRADRRMPIWLIYGDSPRAGQVIDAIDELGYPVLPAAALARQPESARREADLQLALVLGWASQALDTASDAEPGAGATAELELVGAVGGSTTRAGSCAVFTASAPGGHLTVSGDALAVRVEPIDGSPVDASVRSLADRFTSPPSFGVDPATPRDITLRANDLRPWQLRLATAGSFQVCPRR